MIWAAAATGMAGAAAATGLAGATAAAAAAATGMASAGGADSEADTTRPTTEQSFPGAGWGERRKREGEDGRYVRDSNKVRFWQG